LVARDPDPDDPDAAMYNYPDHDNDSGKDNRSVGDNKDDTTSELTTATAKE